MKQLNKHFEDSVILKGAEVEPGRFRFIISSDTVDRVGDIVRQNWTNLRDIARRGLPALSWHDHTSVVGRWFNFNITKDGKKNVTIADLELLPREVNETMQTLWALAERGWLAVSIGFKPIKYEPLDEDNPYGGYDLIENELLETSLVAVGANPDALPYAKSYGIVQDVPVQSFAEVYGAKSQRTIVHAASGETVKRAKAAILAANQILRNK